MTGKQGPQGREGIQGREGAQGVEGREGDQGIQGEEGPMGEAEPGLKKEVQALINLVAANTQALTVSEETQNETRRLARRANVNTGVAIIAAVASLFASVALGVVLKNQADTDQTVCENANIAREAQRTLWKGIVDAPNNQETKVERTNGRRLIRYVNRSFADRDCEDLGKKVEQFDFPKLKKEK